MSSFFQTHFNDPPIIELLGPRSPNAVKLTKESEVLAAAQSKVKRSVACRYPTYPPPYEAAARVAPSHPHFSFGCSHQAGRHPQHGGFSRAVWAEKSVNFPWTQSQVEIVDNPPAAERSGNAESLDYWCRGSRVISHRHRSSRERRALQMNIDVVRDVNRILWRNLVRRRRITPTEGMVGDRPEVDYRRPLILQTASLRPLDASW